MAVQGVKTVPSYIMALQGLLANPDFAQYIELLEKEKTTIVKKIGKAADDRDLRVFQGGLVMIERVLELPEKTLERYAESLEEDG